MSVIRRLSAIRNILIVLLTPIAFLPLLIAVAGEEASCGYVMIIMAVYWITEALPIYVTGLLPIFLFPVLGVMSAGDVGSVFVNGASLMFTGSLIVAIAVEEWDIHKRIALRMLLLLGSKPALLLLGIMLTSWFLSMWISNTATTAMMLPIVTAILDHLSAGTGSEDESHIELAVTEDEEINTKYDAEKEKFSNGISKDCEDSQNYHNKKQARDSCNWNKARTVFYLSIAYSANIGGCATMTGSGPNLVLKAQTDFNETPNYPKTRHPSADLDWNKARKVFNLSVAYSANVGGSSTMTGSTPNLVLKAQTDLIYDKLGRETPLTYGIWLLYGVPTTLIIVLLAWLWLLGLHYKCSFAQVAVIGHLMLLVLLWITRDLGGAYGWSHFFKEKYINDAVPSILVGAMIFVCPSTIPPLFCCKTKESTSRPIQPLLSWGKFNNKMPWGVVLLLGGGFSMAKAAQVSGLSKLIGNKLSALESLEPWLLTLVLCIVIAACTEVTSNTATTALVLPILSDLAVTLKLEPIYLMMPAMFAASFAFMLPVATAPNAVVFSSGHIKVLDMVKAGSLLNIIAVLVLLVMNETLGKVVF